MLSRGGSCWEGAHLNERALTCVLLQGLGLTGWGPLVISWVTSYDKYGHELSIHYRTYIYTHVTRGPFIVGFRGYCNWSAAKASDG